MNKLIINFFLITFLIFAFLDGCRTKETSGKQKESADQSTEGGYAANKIIVYGSKTCPHCVAFLKKMDEAGISYNFREVDNNDDNFKEMLAKIHKINYGGYIQYPVLDVNGEIMIAPEFEAFKKSLE